MKCPNCNKEVNDSFKFCPYCATPIVVANKCPHCGSTNLPADSKFCPDCGGKIEDKESSNNKFITVIVEGVAFNMIYVEHGEFMMGATDEQEYPNDYEKPVHRVRITHDYYIGETPVTQALWRAVMHDNPSYFGEGEHGNYIYEWEELPVDSVNWDDCQFFIRELNRLTGQKFRLPTEAEWEFAARGGKKSAGFQYSGGDYLGHLAWYYENSNYEPHPVKELDANELDIYDMSGNIREWCQDWFGDYNGIVQSNPTGPNCGIYRVVRGGGCGDDAIDCRSSNRNCYATPSNRNIFIGFRLALSKS